VEYFQDNNPDSPELNTVVPWALHPSVGSLKGPAPLVVAESETMHTGTWRSRLEPKTVLQSDDRRTISGSSKNL